MRLYWAKSNEVLGLPPLGRQVPPAMLGMFGRKDSEAEHAKADLAKEHAELVKVKQDLEAERQVHFHGDDR